jgi:hypothetical protein
LFVPSDFFAADFEGVSVRAEALAATAFAGTALLAPDVAGFEFAAPDFVGAVLLTVFAVFCVVAEAALAAGNLPPFAEA